MPKELIISSNAHEKKIAIVENGQVVEFYVERTSENQGVVGNIYKGRVMKVLPGMQSAFVDIGLERDAFLYVSDVFEEEDVDLERIFIEEESKAAPRVQEKPRQQARADFRGKPAEQPEAVPELAEAYLAEVPEIEGLPAEASEEFVAAPEESEEQIVEAAPVEELEAIGELEQPEEVELVVESASEDSAKRSRKARRGKQAEMVRLQEMVAEPEDILAGEEDEKALRKKKKAKRASAASNKRASKRSKKASQEELIEEAEETVVAAPLVDEGERLERITDEDLVREAGEMLKDALLEEKIVSQLHAAEFGRSASTLPSVEPPLEVHVGSLQSQFTTDPTLERIIDELPVEPAAAVEQESQPVTEIEAEQESEPATEAELQQVEPMTPIADILPLALAGTVPVEEHEEAAQFQQESTGEETISPDLPEPVAAAMDTAERAALSPDRQAVSEQEPIIEENLQSQGQESAIEESLQSPDQEPAGEHKQQTTDEQLPDQTEGPVSYEDAEASLRQSPHYERFANRRSGRSRRPRRSSGQAHAERAEPVERQERREEPRGNGRPYSATISELLREGQEIIVQIAKEPIGSKGARITSHIALPGRYVVYMPTVDHVGVSRKIPSDEERIRLKRMMSQIKKEENAPGGFIVRTAGEGCSEEEMRNDTLYLLRTWAEIRKKAERTKAPAIIHRDLDLVQRILRDQLSEDFTAIRVDSESEYARIIEFVNRINPKMVKRIKLYTRDTPIFEEYGIQEEIDKALKPRVWLKSGGYIVINQTEALVAIDVNTGKFVGKSNRLEDTIVKTNLDAVKEIVRQIRLRDLGGIIVLDFIDMEERKNRQKVMQALEEELKADRSPSKILQFNDFGLVAITRKRVKQSIERTLCTPCPYCQGGGMVKSPQTVCYEILAEAKRIAKHVNSSSDVILRVNPEVAKALRESERDVLREIEDYLGCPVNIKSDQLVHQEQFDFAIM